MKQLDRVSLASDGSPGSYSNTGPSAAVLLLLLLVTLAKSITKFKKRVFRSSIASSSTASHLGSSSVLSPPALAGGPGCLPFNDEVTVAQGCVIHKAGAQ